MEDLKDLVPETSKRIKLSNTNSENLNQNDNGQELCNSSLMNIQSAEDNTSSEACQMDNPIVLPMELILKIISHINNVKDLIKCFCISKELYKMMYKTPDIMRNISYKLTCRDDEKLLKYRGKFVRRLIFSCFKDDRKYFLPSLKYTPNVEDLTLIDIAKSRYYFYHQETDTDFESGSDAGSFIVESDYESYGEEFANIRVNCYINLPKLQSLSITNQLQESIKSLNVENLIKLSVTFDSRYWCFAVFVNFFCQLKNLKELSFKGDAVFRFPNRDYMNIVQCRLKKIEMSFSSKLENHNFVKFLETQATEVEELNLDIRLDEDEFEVIFTKFLKLTRLLLGCEENFNFLSNEWELPSLKFYEQPYGSTINLDKLIQKFPNLETFVGNHLMSVDLGNCGQKLSNLKVSCINELINGQFLTINLSSISVSSLDLNELKEATFPNLIYLKAGSVIGLNEEIWKDFTAGLKSIEHISLKNLDENIIEALTFPSYVSLIFKHLKDIKTLKMVELFFSGEILTINLVQKSVKCSWSKSCDNTCYKEVLKTFEGFKFLDCDNLEVVV